MVQEVLRYPHLPLQFLSQIMQKIKVTSFTDESGQDTQGRLFVVCTICLPSDKVQQIEEKLIKIEEESGKVKKWYETGDQRRHKYIDLIQNSKILNQPEVYYSIYKNKLEYIALIGSHIAKAILAFTKDQQYEAKIFIDKTDKTTISNIGKEIKSFHIRYKKIRGLSDKADPLIRLADAICGMIRDLNRKNIPKSYTALFSKLKEV